MTTKVSGFRLICSLDVIECYSNENVKVEYIELGDYYYVVSCGPNIIKIAINDSIVFIDGYTFPIDFTAIACAISEGNYRYLNQVEGHFSGVAINNDGVMGFNDRYGGKTLYWQEQGSQLIVTSRIAEMPIYNLDINNKSLYESFNYRWTTGRNTLLLSIDKLMVRHVVYFNSKSKITQQEYWNLPEPDPDSLPLSKKIAKTKRALVNTLRKASKRYKKVAIFLSGGVDSSILAALSKDIFEQCYLITPVFPNENNPELETAKVFAQTLGLAHHLIEIKPLDIESDLKKLISLKQEPLRHYSSLAMMAMMKAVPADCDAVIYGEAADTLYGSNGVKLCLTHAAWKKQTQYISLIILRLLQKIVPGRGSILVQLKSKSLREIILSVTKIKYSSVERNIIAQLCDGCFPLLDDWKWDEALNDVSAYTLRHAAQERILASDAAVHFNEAEIIAQYYGKHIISPFFSDESIQISKTLTNDEYFGTSFVKPVLRELACEFFPRELIYQKKYGFPVPFIAWLDGPLKDLVKQVKTERVLFDGRLLNELDVSNNFEIFWLLINWQLVQQNLAKNCLGIHQLQK